jgi:hypothetical protein
VLGQTISTSQEYEEIHPDQTKNYYNVSRGGTIECARSDEDSRSPGELKFGLHATKVSLCKKSRLHSPLVGLAAAVVGFSAFRLVVTTAFQIGFVLTLFRLRKSTLSSSRLSPSPPSPSPLLLPPSSHQHVSKPNRNPFSTVFRSAPHGFQLVLYHRILISTRPHLQQISRQMPGYQLSSSSQRGFALWF